MNFCDAIVTATERHPNRAALEIPCAADDYQSSETVSYTALLARACSIQHGLLTAGLIQGDRVLILSRPGVGLYALLLALLGAGLVPVLVDRGMSRARALAAIRASGVKAAVGDYDILRLWWLLKPLWRLPRFALDGEGFGVRRLQQPAITAASDFFCRSLPAEHHGLITFTSGSTGVPKGADRTHQSLIAQHQAIREHWPELDNEIDAPCFPVLVLHNLCCGIRTVLPATDLAKPGAANAPQIARQFQERKVTRLACAPAFLARLVDYALSEQLVFPSLRSVVIGGSTLPERLAQQCQQVFPRARIRFVYGSTEAEPIADIELPVLLQDWHSGEGHLVGKPAHMAEICLVAPGRPLTTHQQVQSARVPTGAVGEILVAGSHVLAGYVDNPAANQASKIPRPDGLTWHRTGDTGYLDDDGRLWLMGRVKDTLHHNGRHRHPLALEKHLDALPGVERSAVLQDQDAGANRLLIIIEGFSDADDMAAVLQQLQVTEARWATVDSMPVDGRHNSKIDRERLRDLLRRNKLKPQLLTLPPKTSAKVMGHV